jgi:hypothetical protein
MVRRGVPWLPPKPEPSRRGNIEPDDFPVISRLQELTRYFGSDKFPVRPHGNQARKYRK